MLSLFSYANYMNTISSPFINYSCFDKLDRFCPTVNITLLLTPVQLKTWKQNGQHEIARLKTAAVAEFAMHFSCKCEVENEILSPGLSCLLIDT